MATDTRVRDALPELLTVPRLAGYLGVPLSTVYYWRNRGEGPPGFKAGKRVYYRTDEVAKWIEKQAEQ